jgi:hypothetical protein
MLKDLPIYEIMIDLNDEETTVEFNSLVHDPAHEISFQTFSNLKRFIFNEEEQVITGVAISADTPIYRIDPSGEEYYVVFTKQAIKDIIHDYARRGNFNNVNLEHDSSRVVNGIYMIHSYQVDAEKGFTAPERFKDVNDGSWIVSYKVTDPEVWAKAKAGEFTGFSVEGVFTMTMTEDTLEDQMMSKIFEELKSVKEYIHYFDDYPQAMSNNAQKGIELHEKAGLNKFHLSQERAMMLINRQALSMHMIRLFNQYLKMAKNKMNKDDKHDPWSIRFLMWGGQAGLQYTESKLND